MHFLKLAFKYFQRRLLNFNKSKCFHIAYQNRMRLYPQSLKGDLYHKKVSCVVLSESIEKCPRR